MSATEVWRKIPGFDGYEASSLGHIRSLDRFRLYTKQVGKSRIKIRRLHKGRILKPGRSTSGHLSVSLGRNGGSKGVHVLVLLAFIGPAPKGHESCHNNDDPSDNRLSNLRWGTRSENLFDAVRNRKKPIGERVAASKLRDRDIPRIREASARGDIAALAMELNVNESTIRQVRYGRTWKHIP